MPDYGSRCLEYAGHWAISPTTEHSSPIGNELVAADGRWLAEPGQTEVPASVANKQTGDKTVDGTGRKPLVRGRTVARRCHWVWRSDGLWGVLMACS